MRPVEGHPVHQSARAGIVGFARNASRPGRLSTDYTYQKRTSMSEQTERRRIRLVTGGILLALALIVVALRLFRLDEIPLGLSYDSGAHGVDALQVLKGEHAAFFPEWNSTRRDDCLWGCPGHCLFGEDNAGSAPARGPCQRWHGLCPLLAGAGAFWQRRKDRAGHPVARPVDRRHWGRVACSFCCAHRYGTQRRSGQTSCRCSYVCALRCFGEGGVSRVGGTSCWRAYAPGCFPTPTLRRFSHHSCFSSSA